MQTIQDSPGGLTPESSQLAERREHHLPPKTYADAAEEAIDGYMRNVREVPMAYEGNGEDDAPRSPVRKPRHTKSGSLHSNGNRKDKKDRKIIEEDLESSGRGSLMTVKLPTEHEEGLRQAKKEKSMAKGSGVPALVSGRTAGAGWERSGLVFFVICNQKMCLLTCQYPLGTSQCSSEAPPADISGSVAHPLHRHLPHDILLSLRHPHFLANPASLPTLPPVLLGWSLRHSFSTL